MYKLIALLILATLAKLSINHVLCDDERGMVNESLDYVKKQCDFSLKQIDSIRKFEEFLHHYKLLLTIHEKPKAGFFTTEKRLRQCYEEEEAIVELEMLVKERGDGICRQSFIDKLVQYHFKYIAKDTKDDTSSNEDSDDDKPSNSNPPRVRFIKYFFSYFAHQVGYTCKSRIAAKLKEAQSQQDCSIVLGMGFPQVFDSQDGSDPSVGQEKTMTEISNFLAAFDRVENFVPVMKFRNFQTPQGFYEVLIPDEAIDRIGHLKDECKTREPLYTTMFSPVAALAQLGYTVEGSDKLTENMEEGDKRLLKCWLATAQLCQGILRTMINVNNEAEIDAGFKSKMVTIKWAAQELDDSKVPSPETASGERQLDLSGSLDEISPYIVSLVNKKLTIRNRVKAKALNYVKKFIKNHIDVDAMQQEAEKNLIDAMTDVDNGIDSKVAFAGKKFDTRQFNPVSKITQQADTAVKVSSSFWGKHIGLIFSSVVGIVMSGVFVWFSLYALATVIKQHHFSHQNTGNFKDDYLKLRQERIDKINKHSMSKFEFYKPT